jgi:methyltransferase (TIGR00027 family)
MRGRQVAGFPQPDSYSIPAPKMSDPPVRGVADTARWVALYRAEESERRDAHFRDPWARRLAGDRGAQIYAALPRSTRRIGWSFVARTVLFDQLIQDEVAVGVTRIINLAAGLDTRPYRLPLPSTLEWIEVDQPDLLAEKAALLADVRPACRLERLPLDLTAEKLRQEQFRRWSQPEVRTLILTEGLLVYLTEAQVTGLANDLAQQPGFRSWATDLISPRLLQMIRRDVGRQLATGGAPFQFAPEAGPDFFARLGWTPMEVHPMMTTAARLKRSPPLLRLLAKLPGVGTFHPRRPWSGVCLLKRPAPSPPAT